MAEVESSCIAGNQRQVLIQWKPSSSANRDSAVTQTSTTQREIKATDSTSVRINQASSLF